MLSVLRVRVISDTDGVNCSLCPRMVRADGRSTRWGDVRAPEPT